MYAGDALLSRRLKSMAKQGNAPAARSTAGSQGARRVRKSAATRQTMIALRKNLESASSRWTSAAQLAWRAVVSVGEGAIVGDARYGTGRCGAVSPRTYRAIHAYSRRILSS
jgi:hypothetical protein